MKLLLLRHGQTDWNAADRYQGRSDIALNDRGVQQARGAAQRLASVPLDLVLASPLARARRTAEIALAGRGLEIRLDDGLMETAGGSWEGLTYAEIAGRWPGDYAAWRASHPEHGPVAGETPGEAGARVVTTLESSVGERQDGQVLVVAHGGCLRAATAHLLGGGPELYGQLERLQNGRMIVLEGSFAEPDRPWERLGHNV